MLSHFRLQQLISPEVESLPRVLELLLHLFHRLVLADGDNHSLDVVELLAEGLNGVFNRSEHDKTLPEVFGSYGFPVDDVGVLDRPELGEMGLQNLVRELATDFEDVQSPRIQVAEVGL